MRTTSRMIAALVLALGATGAVAQTPPGGEGGSGTGASPPAATPPAPAPAAPPPAAPTPASTTPPPTAPAAPPPAAQTPAPAVPAQAQQGTPATVLDTQDYESLLGRSVRSAQGDELGRVIDVIIDKEGHPRAAIIDFGGFLGVGTRKIAVDWRALRFVSDGKELRLSVALTRNQVRVSPEYKSGEPIVVLGPASSGAAAPPAGEAAGVSQPTGSAPAQVQAPQAAPPQGATPQVATPPAAVAPPVATPPASPAPTPAPNAAPEKAPDK